MSIVCYEIFYLYTIKIYGYLKINAICILVQT